MRILIRWYVVEAGISERQQGYRFLLNEKLTHLLLLRDYEEVSSGWMLAVLQEI